LQQVELENIFDLIYFDAFGPPTQPEMWVESVFSKIYETIKLNGCLVTYCAKGEVKRTLKKVGFTVESLPGPLGKREMVRAIKK
jgi:tRNA U34 5-methylaminomethyl-2-thiouridine-forming methyltransferase MnmC